MDESETNKWKTHTDQHVLEAREAALTRKERGVEERLSSLKRREEEVKEREEKITRREREILARERGEKEVKTPAAMQKGTAVTPQQTVTE